MNNHSTWYSSIADLYDGLVRFDEDIPFFVDYCSRSDGQVLELMSGTGRVSISLLEAGHELTCVDSSPEMLECFRAKLRARKLSAKIFLQDVRHLTLPQEYKTAIIPFNSFSEITAAVDRRTTLGSVYNYLVAGGCFICTLHNPAVKLKSVSDAPKMKSRFPHPAGKGEVLFQLELRFDPQNRTVDGVQIFDIYSESGELEERRRVTIRYCLPERNWFSEAARETGFEIESLFGNFDYSDYREDSSPYMIWVLRKPGNV